MQCSSCGSENPAKQKFCGECGHPLEGENNWEGSNSSPDQSASGERRQVTVLFSDLSGYTAITEKLDPEEVREVMGRFFGEASQVITRYGGVVEKYIGDAVMAVFGLNQAHEDDAVRAVRAALEIQQFVEELNPRYRVKVGRDLSMHTGINTGIVITGGTGEAEGALGVVGDAVNVASRLSDLAEAGQVLVGADTAPLIEKFFDLEALPTTQVKGKSEAVSVFRVLGPRERPVATRRFAGLRAGLVGRDVEMALLNQAIQRLRDGRGSIISLRGEAGTGKSRLIDEFRENVQGSHQWLAGNAYDHTQGIPYFPVVDMISHAWGIEEGDKPQQVQEKLDAHCRAVMDDAEPHMPYLGALFSLEYPETATVSPEFRKQKIHNALLELFQAQARQSPTVFFVEDMHWADPSTVELLRHVLTHFQVPAITLSTYRPPFALFPGDGEVPGYREMELEILSASLVGDLTAALLKGGEPPVELQTFIQEKSGGNPFYVEEVLTSLMESGVLRRENGGWQLAGALESFNVPGTLQGVIAARLDRLEPANKKLLQEASVIGRNFFYEVLAHITSVSADLQPRLEGLEGQDMIRAQALEPDLEYMFKHPLTQEVVYNSLLLKDRQTIHERVGKAIEEVLAERLPEYYERLAHHFLNGQTREKAVEYLMKAGEKALAHFALDESDRYYQQGFDLLNEKKERNESELENLADLFDKWAMVFYYRGTFKQLYHLLTAHEQELLSIGDKSRVGTFYLWKGWSEYFIGKFKDANTNLHRALKLGEEAADSRIVGYAHAWLSFVNADSGRLDEAVSHGEKANQISREMHEDQMLFTKSRFGLAWSNERRGDIKALLQDGTEILSYSRERSYIRGQMLGHSAHQSRHMLRGDWQAVIAENLLMQEVVVDPMYSIVPYFGLTSGYLISGRIDEAEEAGLKLQTYLREVELEIWIPFADGMMGLILIVKGKMSLGMKMLREAMQAYHAMGAIYYAESFQNLVGNTYLQLAAGEGKPPLMVILRNLGFLLKTLPVAAKKAEHHFNNVISESRKRGFDGLLAKSLLELGMLHKVKNRKNKAEACLTEAEELFEQMGADVYLTQTRDVLAGLEAKTI